MRQEDEADGPQDTGKAQEPEGSAEKAGSKKDKYQKAQAKAEHAGEKLGKAREKLDKTEAKRAAKKPPGLAKKAVRGVRTEAWFYVHNKIHEVEHENVGVEGAHKSELVAEAGARKLTRYAKRRWQEHPARKVAKWERKDIKARANVDFQKMASEHPELASNPLSRVQQKWKLKRRYSKEAKAAAKQGAKAAKKTAAASGTATRRAAQFVTRHPVAVLVLLLLLLLCFLVSAVSSIFPTLGSGLANALSGTSYASEDTDLLGVDEDYTALENELAQTVANIESTHPGYDEYRYSVDEIGHNPYELASYLSAKYHVYFREQVQDELREIFEAQYELTLTEKVEIRYRTETSTDPETGETTTEEVPYEYYILNVTLTNKTLPAVILPRLNEQQREIYTVMQQLKGNKPYLWEGIYNGGEDTGPSYEIPGEALDDPAFAALMEEATKYIGWPYVWGGSSPSTSFDCSGFVCWVYTASGVHGCLESLYVDRIHLYCAFSSENQSVHGYQHTFADRFFGSGSDYGIVEVQRAIGTQRGRRAHGSYKYHGFVTFYGQVQEIGSLFHRICSVSDNDTVDVRAFQELVDLLGEYQPHFIAHVLRCDTYNLLTGHVGNILEFGYCIEQRTDCYLAGRIVGGSGRTACTGNCATRSKDVNIRLLRESHHRGK